MARALVGLVRIEYNANLYPAKAAGQSRRPSGATWAGRQLRPHGSLPGWSVLPAMVRLLVP